MLFIGEGGGGFKRAMRGVTVDDGARVKRIHPAVFHRQHPMRPRLRLHVCASLNEPPQGASPGVAMPNDSIWEEWDDAESDKICLVTLRHVCPYMTDWVQKQTLQICWQLSARMDELQTETGRGFHRWKWRLLIFFTFLLRAEADALQTDSFQERRDVFAQKRDKRCILLLQSWQTSKRRVWLGRNVTAKAAQRRQQPLVLKHTEVTQVHLHLKGKWIEKKQRCFFIERMAEVFRNDFNGSLCLHRRVPLKLHKQVRLLFAAWNKIKPIDCWCTTWQTWHCLKRWHLYSYAFLVIHLNKLIKVKKNKKVTLFKSRHTLGHLWLVQLNVTGSQMCPGHITRSHRSVR